MAKEARKAFVFIFLVRGLRNKGFGLISITACWSYKESFHEDYSLLQMAVVEAVDRGFVF